MDNLLADVLANPVVSTAGMAIGLAAIALWLAAAWWAYADAIRRTDRDLAGYVAAAWVVLSTPLMLPLALGVYALVRPPVAAGDARVRRLVEALQMTAADRSCPGCATPAEPDWHRCPACATWLASPCSACGRWSGTDLELCPWCGDEARRRPSPEDADMSVTDTLALPDTLVAAATAFDAHEPAPERPSRLSRRTGSPTPPRSRRPSRRLALGFDGRRLVRP